MRTAVVAAVVAVISGTSTFAAPPVPADHAAKMAASRALFAKTVRGYLTDQCLRCHGGEKTRSGFSLADRKTLLEGGDSGVAVVPGKAAESRLMKLLHRTDEPHMPPKMTAPKAMVTAIGEWIDLGAAYDKPLTDTAPDVGKAAMVVTAKDKKYWAYQPSRTPPVPEVDDADWPANPIDRFVLAKMEAANVTPAAASDKRTLIRRVTFDLIGLPPTPADVEAFVLDKSPDAYEKVVDRLLASPQFGERWARHWLDPARFAESHGFEHDYLRPHAYHYRDFVIRAFNADMPYDRFVRWQIAGDELAPNDPMALAATGFLGAGVYPTQITTTEAERVRYDAMDDMLATTGHAVLALTVGCARCHDHKYDPIPTQDYYRMLSAFTTTVRSEVEVDLGTPAEKAAMAAWKAKRDMVGAIGAGLCVPSFDREKPKDTVATMQICTEGLKPMRHHTAVGSIPDFYKETFILDRGDVAQKQEVADLGVLQVLTRTDDGVDGWFSPPPAGSRTSGRRTALANWLVDTDAGAGSLAARVIVNRLWHHHFGRGIVATVNDFGFQGQTPTHPELLDWLASDLVEHGWTLKRIHKLMVMSRTYQQAGTTNPKDVDNRFWSHYPRRRLEAEAIRDNLLAVGGRFDPTMFGPGSLNEGMTRRSIYFTVKRSQLIPTLQVFDWPDTLTSAGVRPTTVVAPQALLFLNNPQVRASAQGFANRLKAAKTPAETVDLAYRIAFARPPSAAETAAGVVYLKGHSLTDYTQALMGLNEFIYVD